ncbi:MAG: hypothetical protein R2797_02565 [Gelidibacter sp.]
MSEKKHIDRLFQEKLKDFEVSPDDTVWDNIQASLDDKEDEKRRVIPLWWKLAGIAALLALLLTVGIKFMFNDSNSNTQNPIVDTEKQSSDKSKDDLKSDTGNSKDIRKNSTDSQMETSSKIANEESSNGTFHEGANNNSKKNGSNKNGLNDSEANHTKVANNSRKNSRQNNKSDDTKNTPFIENNQEKDAIVDYNIQKKDSFYFVNPNQKSETNKLIKDSKSNPNSAVTDASKKMEDILIEDQKDEEKTEKSIEEAIAEANTEEEKDEKETKLNRWNISPNVAPVYFNSLGKGSSLDEQFVNNTKDGDVTMSYGVGGSYAINDKLKIRVGINKVDMGYSTNDVIAFKSIDSLSHARTQLTNISTNENAEYMTYLSAESLDRNITPEIINTKTKGAISQRFGFIEVPMEVEYALVNKKVGVNVIGGFSTLIVDKNEIYSIVDGTETRIGEANNINNMSYSANFGLGLNYNISEKIKVNVEPTFKYQINTFNNSSGDFKPYFIGVYTGLSYKF